MALKFWNDPDGQRYLDTYFSMIAGVWRHGDWITITDRGSVIISGRSDATLNRHGVRLGSADIYDVVDGVELDDRLRERISQQLRTKASPRHVPDDIIAVPAVPHTRTGK